MSKKWSYERVLSFQQREEIIFKHFKNKIPQSKLAKEYNVSRITINRHCQNYGKSPLIKTKANCNEQEIIDLYVIHKMSINQIFNKLSLTRRLIKSILIKNNIDKKELSKDKRIRWEKEIPQYRLKEDVWAHKVYDRDGLKCRKCDSIIKLEAHHIIPVRDIIDVNMLFDLDNGITLCQSCHKKTIYREYEFVDLFKKLNNEVLYKLGELRENPTKDNPDLSLAGMQEKSND